MNFKDKLAALSEKAADQLAEYVRAGGGYVNMDANDVISYAYALAQKYGEGAGTLAATMYDAIAELEGAIVPPAEVADVASYGEVAKAIRGAAKTSTDESYLGSVLGRMVKRTGADTTLNNAIRDGAEFAWVPSGDTCAFCLTLASRGWQKASKKALKNGHAEHIHANCDCTYAVRFDGKSTVAGYDPDKYLEMYRNADGNTPQEKINAIRRIKYAQNKDQINAQKREAYKKQKSIFSDLLDYYNVTKEYYQKSTPKIGDFIFEGRKFKNREKDNMALIYETFGGDISAPIENNTPGIKNPDFVWKKKYWEEQEPVSRTKNAIDNNIHEAIKQIRKNPGGIVLDIGDSEMSEKDVHEAIMHRLRRSADFDCDVMVIRNGQVESIYRHKK